MVEKKKGENKQLWRLEDNGCLRNKAHMLKCLGLDRIGQGGMPVLVSWNFKWKYQEMISSEYGYIVNNNIHININRNSILVPDDLSLNVIWGDLPLILDGVPVNAMKQDGTQSMKWKFVEP